MKKLFLIIITVVIPLGLFSCDAERLNPLDPLSPDYKLVYIEGSVKTKATPQQPIAGVKVFWKGQNIITQTDQNGNFKIDDLNMNDGILLIEKEGYSKDSLLVVWSGEKNKRVDFTLNALPVISKYNLFTTVQNKYPDVQNISFTAQVSVIDVDNRIDTVYIRSTELNFSRRLIFNSSSKYYEGTNTSEDLKIASLDIAIGKKFEIVTVDDSRRTFIVGSANVMRIIKQEVIAREPLNKVAVSSRPTLKWFRFLPGFNFKYTIEIYTDEFLHKLVWTKENISKDDIELIPDINLTPGEYFWVIWCVDDFGNRSRSKPASFVVE
ncbi:MAG: carboxypeptidase-like regulatory domain-containing protein [Melioribacter sp.]|nr:carboxypeptidase-like regulatory domain-containing protein [Melioribacter sp.]